MSTSSSKPVLRARSADGGYQLGEAAAGTTAAIAAHDFGLVPYEQAFSAMRQFTLMRDAKTWDELWLLEHEPVYTQGLAGKAEHVGDIGDIPLLQSDRGGQVTYHGPGQLMLYTLIDIRRAGLHVRAFVSLLENTVITTLAALGVGAATANAKAPGVYLGGAKIASLGLRIHRGCSYHGMALNVAMDLTPFNHIRLCGMADTAATQLTEFAPQVSQPQVKALLVERFCCLLQRPTPEIQKGVLPSVVA